MTKLHAAFLVDPRQGSEFTSFIGIFSTERRALLAIEYAKTKLAQSNVRLQGLVKRVELDNPDLPFSISVLEEMADQFKNKS